MPAVSSFRAAVFLLLMLAGSAARAWDVERMLRAAEPRGPQALVGVRALQALMVTLAPSRDTGGVDAPSDVGTDTARLVAVNDFFNRRIRFAPDTEVWGQIDYWASPLETLAQGRGDCEDYVIAKYFTLLALGMPVARLRLVYVRVVFEGSVQAHMVLAYYAGPGAEPLILDNLVRGVLPASRRPDLEPVFSFNHQGLWQGTGSQRAGDPVARLSRWRDVLAKVRSEGFEP